MERTLALAATTKIGEKVRLNGWVNRRRDHGKIVFIDLRDRSGVIQLVIQPGGLEGKSRAVVEEIRSEFAIEVAGTVVARAEKDRNPKLSTGTVEVKIKEIIILAKAESLPFDMGSAELNLELPPLLDHRCLTLRHASVAPIFKVQETIAKTFRKTLKEIDTL